MKPAIFRDLHDLTGSLAITHIQPISLEWKDLPTGRKPAWQGTRLLYADVGTEGLIQHVCRVGLPCWKADASDYDSDLFGGAA